MAEFEIRDRTVYVLYLDGAPIVDPHGDPVTFPTREAAQRVADNWPADRVPLWQELQAMSDEEVRSKYEDLLGSQTVYAIHQAIADFQIEHVTTDVEVVLSGTVMDDLGWPPHLWGHPVVLDDTVDRWGIQHRTAA